MWTSSRCSRATQRGRPCIGVAVALLACVGLSACTVAETPSPASTAAARTVAPFPQSGDIDPGTYLVTGYTVPFEITVPDGWSTFDGANVIKDDPNEPSDQGVFITFWPAEYVPTDACAWQDALVEVDPSAEAFVDAVTAQTSAASTPPVEVMVGDYPGFEFDHSIESDVDIADCDGGRFCVYADFADQCGRWYSSQTERETYRVVDLDGERAVIAMGEFQPVDPALAKERRAVFDSIAFTAGD